MIFNKLSSNWRRRRFHHPVLHKKAGIKLELQSNRASSKDCPECRAGKKGGWLREINSVTLSVGRICSPLVSSKLLCDKRLGLFAFSAEKAAFIIEK